MVDVVEVLVAVVDDVILLSAPMRYLFSLSLL